ncbi:hypothetical protein HC62_00255 [Acetobacter tropicalis]|uniref:Uncharacterized protein n=1 Tax=Acetobacter tropicalis TaxID=104102 RepID=A0A251ZYQ2_9PROT|nr:hypothetical protein HC62_00255 [Acetobacter tropicalis]
MVEAEMIWTASGFLTGEYWDQYNSLKLKPALTVEEEEEERVQAALSWLRSRRLPLAVHKTEWEPDMSSRK